MSRKHGVTRLWSGALGSAALVLVAAACAEGGREPTQASDLRVDSLFAGFTEEDSPGAAVMVVQDGTVLHAEGYGLADIESGRPLSPSTPVRLGSLSKAFAAMAIVLLAERGELSYDQSVTRWVPELARFDGITVRHLLNHTSGLPDYYGGSTLAEFATAQSHETHFANAEAVSVYETWGDPLFSPGERYEYSNPGYEVLGLIAERVAGVPLGQFLEENLFEPLGMSTAIVRDRPETVVPGRAVGYSPDSVSGGWAENDDHQLNWLVGAGGVYASLEDLYQWDQALWEWASSGDRLEEVFAPALLNDGSLSHYGFGWDVSDHSGRSAVQHTGAWVGFRSAIVRFTEQRLTVVVLTNATGPAAELRDSVAALYLAQ